MKNVKVLLLVLATSALTAATAIAAPPASHPGLGAKPPTTGAGCRPQVSVVLRGSVAAAPGTDPVLPFDLMVSVTGANHHGRAYLKVTQPVTVTSDTKVFRQGSATLSDLLEGDSVIVQAHACMADLAHGATPALTATRIVAHPVQS